MRTAMKAALVAAGVAVLAGPSLAQEGSDDSLLLPNMSYRTGPFAGTGTPHMNGQLDYMTLLNERDGGINGVKANLQECETGYNTEKGVECYESLKAEGALITQPWSTGITLQVLPKTNVDEIPVYAPSYGFSAMQDGNIFKWAFNTPISYWDGASMIIKRLNEQESLEGKKIAFLHLDHPYGKEPIPLFEKLAEEHGYEFIPIPVGISEMQNQSAQWLQIRRESPDYVVMWGWGAMNAGALTEAAKTNYPMDQFISVWWGAHDPALRQVGEEGAGFRAISWNFTKSDAPVMQEIKEYVVDAGKSKIDPESGEFDSMAYQRGVMMSIILAEAVRAAQDHAGEPTITAEQLRWGLENINLDEARLEELGATGMMGPLTTSCADHTGHSGAWMVEWDGEKFVKTSELLKADRELIDPMVEEAATEYAESNAPWPTENRCEQEQ